MPKASCVDIIQIICAKREGKELTRTEIAYAIDAFMSGEVTDYQMSALLMAVCLRGMSQTEAVDLTEVLIDSGVRLDLSAISGPTADKHSTGGVGDKSTLVAVPIAAAAGVTIAKLSGRSLGHTGGTLDKLEAIPGVRTTLATQQFVEQANRIGLVIAGQSSEMVPADKKLYGLRDVTGTVASIPLITASIVAKKIAGGAASIVYDVKAGSGALLKSLKEARALARSLVDVTKRLGANSTALVTDMEQPLGLAVGNALEIAEAVDVLAGAGPADVRELSIALSARMIEMAGLGELNAATKRAEKVLDDGAAQRKFAEMIEAQEGDAQVAFEPERFLPRAPYLVEANAASDGYVTAIDAEAIGCAARALGAGRTRTGEGVDLAAGIVLRRKLGDPVQHGDEIAVLHTSNEDASEEAAAAIEAAYTLEPEPPTRGPLILEVVE